MSEILINEEIKVMNNMVENITEKVYAGPWVEKDINFVMIDDRKINISISIDLPRVVVFEKFLTDEECDKLIELAKPRLSPSTTIETDGTIHQHPARTSKGMFFHRGQEELITKIENRIAKVVHWPVENGEGLQILHYQNGERYLPHNDYFEPNATSPSTHLVRSGNRVGTFLMYLSTPDHGGCTSFPESNIRVNCIKGNALFFSYHAANASTKTLHGGDPVLVGEKYVATKWLRQKSF